MILYLDVHYTWYIVFIQRLKPQGSRFGNVHYYYLLNSFTLVWIPPPPPPPPPIPGHPAFLSNPHFYLQKNDHYSCSLTRGLCSVSAAHSSCNQVNVDNHFSLPFDWRNLFCGLPPRRRWADCTSQTQKPAYSVLSWCEPVWSSGKALRLVSRRASVRFRFGSPFSSKKKKKKKEEEEKKKEVVVCDTVLWPCPS